MLSINRLIYKKIHLQFESVSRYTFIIKTARRINQRAGILCLFQRRLCRGTAKIRCAANCTAGLNYVIALSVPPYNVPLISSFTVTVSGESEEEGEVSGLEKPFRPFALICEG